MPREATTLMMARVSMASVTLPLTFSSSHAVPCTAPVQTGSLQFMEKDMEMEYHNKFGETYNLLTEA